MLKFIKRYFAFIILVFIFIAHIPFLDADIDYQISKSRAPWTDEGVYSSQIRNLILHDNLTIDNSPCFFITPLFSSTLYFPFKIFGISLKISRIITLCFCFSILIFMYLKCRYFRSLILVLTPLILFQYYIFHFLHIGLAEMYSIFSILLGIFFFQKSILNDSNKSLNLFLSALFISFTYLFKIQFLYVLFVIPLFTSLYSITSYFNHKKINKTLLNAFLKHSLFIFFFLSLYFILWYLPNKESINFIINHSDGNKFLDYKQLNILGLILDFIHSIYYQLFLKNDILILTLSFLVLLPIGFIFVFLKQTSENFKISFIAFLSWFIIEMHKFTILNIPTRYMISLYFVIGLIISVIILESFQLFKLNKKNINLPVYLSIIIIVIFISNNIILYKKTLSRRTFDIEKINNYMENNSFISRPMMGAWAGTFSWKTNSISYPIWDNYYNYDKIIEKFNPKILIYEDVELPLYFKEGINIREISDSIVTKKIVNWDINIAWIK